MWTECWQPAHSKDWKSQTNSRTICERKPVKFGIRSHGSVGRAHRSHRWGHRFESCCDHQKPLEIKYFRGFFFCLWWLRSPTKETIYHTVAFNKMEKKPYILILGVYCFIFNVDRLVTQLVHIESMWTGWLFEYLLCLFSMWTGCPFEWLLCPVSMWTGALLDVNGLPDRHTSYKNRYRCGFMTGIMYSMKKDNFRFYCLPNTVFKDRKNES